jgi:hypothetical protein
MRKKQECKRKLCGVKKRTVKASTASQPALWKAHADPGRMPAEWEGDLTSTMCTKGSIDVVDFLLFLIEENDFLSYIVAQSGKNPRKERHVCEKQTVWEKFQKRKTCVCEKQTSINVMQHSNAAGFWNSKTHFSWVLRYAECNGEIGVVQSCLDTEIN